MQVAFHALLVGHRAGNFKHANKIARALVAKGFDKAAVEDVVASAGLVLAGNWVGKRDADVSRGESADGCKFCHNTWSDQCGIKPRTSHAFVCSGCDSAGRALGARSDKAISGLYDKTWAKFLELSAAAQVRAACRFQDQQAAMLAKKARKSIA